MDIWNRMGYWSSCLVRRRI